MHTALLGAALVGATLFAVACSSASGSDPSSETGGAGGAGGASAGAGGGAGTPSGPPLKLEPPDAVIDPEQGETVTYKVTTTNDAGAEEDVTAEAVFSALPQHIFKGSTIELNLGSKGVIDVVATARGRQGKARVLVAKKVFGPGTGPEVSGSFQQTADPASGPELVYPPSGILVPPNMNSLEFHFIPAPGQKVFELRLIAGKASLTAYFGCEPLQNGCVYSPDKAFWSLLADKSRGLGPVRYELRGLDPATGAVGLSKDATIEFASEDIVGGIYYWNAGAGIIQRYDFGYPGQKAENYMTAANAGGGFCVGCHVLSRDGKRIVAGLDIPAPSVFKLFDVATKKMIFSQGSLFPGDPAGANFFSFSPDAKQIMTSDGNKISLRDGETGKPIIDTLVTQAAMPDWSPKGDLMVFARPGAALGIAAPGISSGSIELLSFDGTAWGNQKTLVPFSGGNNYYPSFSPDQGWIVFNRSPANQGSMDNATKETADGQLWLVSPEGGSPIQLLNASPKGEGDQWAKWSPNEMTYAGGKVMWITFTSVRSYGLRLGLRSQPQLWMAAIDPARAAAGQDPSFPAFWLPFQDMASGNHIAQWVSEIVRKDCTVKSECESSEICEKGFCVPDIK